MDYHGTRYWYVKGCRCDQCRDANRVYSVGRLADRREKARVALEQNFNVVEHGKDSTYTNWGCRCEACSEVHRVTCKKQRTP